MKEILAEVFAVMKGNKVRIALTGLSIAWGIFIFIVLISAGRGIINGMNLNFKVFHVGVVTLTPRETSQPAEGRALGSAIRFYEADAVALDSLFGDTVKKAIPVMCHPIQARRGKEYTYTTVDGYPPGYAVAPNVRIVEGRDINDLDMLKRRKVCVIPKRLQHVLFNGDTTAAIGKEVLLNGISFQVIGVYEPLLSTNITRAIVAPLNTVKQIWCPDGQLSHIYLETDHLNSATLNQQFNARVLRELAARKGFAPTDKHAVKIENLYEQPVMISNVLIGLSFFVLLVGLATLISGVVGVSNIMLISVRERTQEIGIRRAMGAKASQIVVLVLTESVIICLLFGYVGMFLGIELMELVAEIIRVAGGSDIFYNPTVSPAYVLAVSCIMVMAGIAAGYVPAKQAVSTKVVEAVVARQTVSSRRGQRLMTAFGVFWGILILVLLVGGGRGLDNGVVRKFRDLPPNEMWIVPQETSMPYRGFARDRRWRIDSHDEESLRQRFAGDVTSFSALCYADYQNVTRGDQTQSCQVTGVVPQFTRELPQRITAGRFINDIDMSEHRKVCVIGEHVADVLFDSHDEAVGKSIRLNGMALTVVGVTHCTNRQMNLGLDLAESVLLPLPTQQAIYGRGDEIDMCSVIMDDAFPLEQRKEELVSLVKENHAIHPDDELALVASTVTELTTTYNNLLTATNVLIWIVGLGTLVAGLIGISNIMLVTVVERTQEIGIRRAIGAKPYRILQEIMLESLVLTLGAGLIGLCTAVWLLHAVSGILPQGDDAVFTNPTVPFWTAIAALLILVVGALLAGMMPTKRALAVKPIEALREE